MEALDTTSALGVAHGVSAARAADVNLVDITKRYGALTAVDQLTLQIPAGSFFALLGPSGCGKTTTLRMIGGFTTPTSGSVLLGDTDVTEVAPYRREVNTVFQSYALFPHMDVAANVGFGLRQRRVPRAEAKRRVAEALELVQLSGTARRMATQLSGGQQQRVALARALVNRPRVLLLDEPLGALDLKLRKRMQRELTRIQHEVGLTFVHVTHDQDEALTMADQIAVMNNGRIEHLGTGAELYETPKTAFVAGFLGVSNLLAGTITSRRGTLAECHVLGGGRVFVPVDRLGNSGSSVRVGVRPEKIRLTRLADRSEDCAEPQNVLEGTVVDMSYLGVALHYLVATDTGVELTVFAQNFGGLAAVSQGDAVRMTWSPANTFVVEPES